MGERVDIVVAASSIDQLRVPPLAITDGSATIEWVDLRVGGSFLRGRWPRNGQIKTLQLAI
jgi:hypothetical protein